jgi:hypothetical protein
MSNITWIEPRRGAHAHSRLPVDYAFRVSTQKSGNRANSGRAEQGAITVSEKAMRALRWQVGDRVMIGRSEDGADVYLKRVPTGGYQLSARGSVDRAKAVGTATVCIIKSARLVFDEPATIGHNDYVVLDNGAVMFTLPKRGAQ